MGVERERDSVEHKANRKTVTAAANVFYSNKKDAGDESCRKPDLLVVHGDGTRTRI